MRAIQKTAIRIALCIPTVIVVVAALTFVQVSDRPLATAISLLIIVILMSSTGWGVSYAVFLSFLAALGFSWSIPPVGHFHLTDPRVPIVLTAYLVSSVTASRLSDRLRRAVLEANQRRAEAVAEQQRFTDLVNSVEGIVWEADAETRVFSFVSRQAERILGYPLEQWFREPTFWTDHIHPEDRDWAMQFRREAVADNRNHDFEYRMVAADGRVVWIRDLVTLVVEDGRSKRVRGVAVDVTYRKRAEEERERLRRLESELALINRVTAMGELTVSLAHEINQPIAAAATDAGTCLRWLAGETPNIREAREAAKRIVEDANRAAEIISRIRLLFKKATSERELVNINEVIKDIIVLLRNEAARNGVSIRSELTPDLPTVMGDRVQLQQVLMNLMINSIDATKNVEGTRELTLCSRADDHNQLLISVRDTGIGLPTQPERIFDAFFTTKPQGTGMGLAISRSIVESHGGRLWATSNSGRGAVFHFTLPTKVEGSREN